MKTVILGGTAGMGQAIARRMASRGDRLFILGLDQDELNRTAADLQVRGGNAVGTHLCDLGRPEMFEPALQAAEQALGGLECVIVTAGIFATQDQLEADRDLNRSLLTIDFTHTVDFCEVARKRLLVSGGGTLVVFSSVAGERARKPVILYGAAKAGLTHYLEGLDHKYRASGLRTICVKPGFVHTAMTAGLKPPPFAAQADEVADIVLRGIESGRPVVHAPPVWGLIMAVIRRLPRAAMRRAGF